MLECLLRPVGACRRTLVCETWHTRRLLSRREPSPRGFSLYFGKLSELLAIEVSDISQGRWGMHFLERGAEQKNFFANAS